ncbi:MAG: hypothetical protein ABEJ87_05610 [Candidatus Nanohalobium sp.]
MASELLERDEEGNYVKTYGDTLNPLRQQYRHLSFSDPLPPGKAERVMNEVRAADNFTEKYIPHPEVLDYSIEDGSVKLENVGGAETVKEYLESAEEDASELGEMMGRLIADIHGFGSHGDPELDNFLYCHGDILSLDHEFYSEEKNIEDIRGDLRLIESDARTLKKETYIEFMKAFEEAYREETESRGDFPVETDFTTGEKTFQFIEGLALTKKRQEDVDIENVLQRSYNLFRNTVDDSRNP